LIGVRVCAPFIARRRRDQIPFILYAAVCGALGIIFARQLAFSLLGRDSTLTGRTNEWAIIFPFALKHFWLGYGYQAFWTGTGDSLRVINALHGAISGADSGYLDTILQFGLMGLGLWVILLLVFLRDFSRLLRLRSMPLAAYWFAGLIITAFVGSFVGSMFLSTGFNSFVFVVACAGLRNLHHERCLSLRRYIHNPTTRE
jgi:exopolysaccharide production protein ExoQ